MPSRTLVVHTGGIGDFILACPALHALAQETPLELAGHKDRLGLAVAAGIAYAAHSLDAIAFDSIFSEPRPALIDFVQRFDRVIVWMRDDGTIGQSLRSLGIPNVQIFPGLPPEDWSRHASDYYAECLGVPAGVAHLAIEPAATTYNVMIHPGSGAKRKNWPSECFSELSLILDKAGHPVAWSLGPAEESVALPPGARLLLPQSLTDLAAALAATRLYIGNDSGITHLAAAVGCPAIAIFGPTNPAVWAPRGSHVRIVSGDPWPSVHDVVQAIDAVMEVR